MTIQTQLLGVHLFALLVLAIGSLVGASTIATIGFAAAFLALASVFVVMTVALVDGLRRRPKSMTATRSKRAQ